MHPRNISILDYTYKLPDERIALHPMAQRDASKLLIYKNGVIEESVYKNIHQYVPGNSLLVFNNTKVIQARILFTKATGGVIEIFCLEPYESINEFAAIMNRKAAVRWKCMIGGASKWKEGALKKEWGIAHGELSAVLIEQLPDAYVVEFSWTPADTSFAEVLEQCGDIPLPPYIKRKPADEDRNRYQTIYAAHDGSVAAPTAGLHFTDEIFKLLAEKNIRKDFVTLHVGAGTFKPVKAATMQQHEMHAEWIDVSINAIKNLAAHTDACIVAIGTTSLRTLESLYWMGVKAILNPSLPSLHIEQWDVYGELSAENITVKEALNGLVQWLQQQHLDRLFTHTQILIAPGYRFKIAKALVTNFHQPQSTLLLLVAAAVGSNWKKLYEYALENDFRFLSYGDGSLLFIAE